MAIGAIIVLVGFFNAYAAEEEKAAEEEIKPFAEVELSILNAKIDDYSGSASYKKPLFRQLATVGLDKNGNGICFIADNFSPSEGEIRETDLYVDAYAEFYGVKIDVGYGRYLVREFKEVDYNGIYIEVVLPALLWGVTPFAKAEYRFSEKIEGVSMDGFMYNGGIKREFQLHERVNLVAEASFGGNTGLYGMPAENIAYIRERLVVSISITEWLKLKGSAMTQQNLGLQDGIAADTDRLFVSAGVVGTF